VPREIGQQREQLLDCAAVYGLLGPQPEEKSVR